VQTVTTNDPRLKGLRVLVVEDETLVAILLEDMLVDLGCTVLGTAHRIAKALDLVGRTSPDAAVLDVNIAGDEVYPVAEALAARNIPFVFATGYGARGLSDGWRDRPIVQKPFQVEHLSQGLLAALAAGPEGAAARPHATSP
jgi:CheY-like chemotaxis protein